MDANPTYQEITLMAAVLRRRFADAAPQIADKFASEHRLIGDKIRARHWDRVVAELCRETDRRTLS